MRIFKAILFQLKMNLNQQRAASIVKAYEQPKKSIREVIEENFAKGAIDQALYESACNQLDAIEKGWSANEGSRGGKVIGHTKSGSPIYAGHFKDDKYHGNHEDYSKQDHLDAADTHQKEAAKFREKRKGYEQTGYGDDLMHSHGHHIEAAREHKKMAESAPDKKPDTSKQYTTKKNQSIGDKTADKNDKMKDRFANYGKSIKKSITDEDFLLDFVLEKAGKGEGSKGGHVIGHTSSGKPIYASGKMVDHPKFSEQDHRDAASLHTMNLNILSKFSKHPTPHDIDQAVHYSNSAKEHGMAADLVSKKLATDSLQRQLQHHTKMAAHHDDMLKVVSAHADKHKGHENEKYMRQTADVHKNERDRHNYEKERLYNNYKKDMMKHHGMDVDRANDLADA